MNEMNPNTAAVFKNIFKAGMLMVLVVAGIQVGGLWTNFQNEFPDATVMQFISYEEKETINPAYQTLSQGFLDKAKDVNNLTRTVWFAIFFFFGFEVFSYHEKKKEHWFYQLTMMMKKRMEKVEAKK